MTDSSKTEPKMVRESIFTTMGLPTTLELGGTILSTGVDYFHQMMSIMRVIGLTV